MTYRGSFPGSGYSDQNGQPGSWPPPQQPIQNGFDAYGNPQFQQQQQQYQHQFQNAVSVPLWYPQQQQQQLQNANFASIQANQFQNYDPNFNHRPQQYSQPSAAYGQIGQMSSSVPAQQPHGGSRMNDYSQQSNHRYAQGNQHPQYAQQSQLQPQQMDWQQMPPPMPSTSPMPSYQANQQQQHSRYPPQPVPPRVNSPHVNSPVTAQSPQYPQQFLPNNNHKIISNGARMEQAGRVSASPRLNTQGLTRSPSVSSTRSPALTPGLLPHHQDTNSLLVCVAEEFFSKARKDVLKVADSLDAQRVHEYQKLIATGLGCLETVLSSNKLAPRLEAKLQLRYASILCEETNNIMEAETALTKGITLSDKYRFYDLKYLMQFLQLKMLSQRKGKAAMITVDKHIENAELLKHTPWVYALRFFKASLYLQSANPSDLHAIDNLKAIINLALQRGDTVIFVVASLLEGLSLLKNMRDDAFVRIQHCIAQSQKYQLDPSIHIPQIDILALMLDFACSLHQKSPQMIVQKMKALQIRMDVSINQDSWSLSDTEIALPIRKQSSNVQVISEDTRAVLRPGNEGDGCDYLTMSFWSKIEAFVMTYTYSGIGVLYQNPRNDTKMFDMWNEALAQLAKNAHKMRSHPTSLQAAIRSADWRRELKCYLQILRGLHLATHCRWGDVQKCVEELENLVPIPLEGVVGLFSVYLSGVYQQGLGNLLSADSIFSNPVLSLDNHGKVTSSGSEVRILAAFNRIWIMQHPDHRNDMLTNELVEQLRLLCPDHPNREMRLIWNLLQAATQTNPPIPVTTAKSHLSHVLHESKALGDVQTLSIALNLIRAKLFQNIVGDQAVKSAKAGASQARKSGNVLWISVADNLLAQSYEVQGQMDEAQNSFSTAVQYANEAIRRREDIDKHE